MRTRRPKPKKSYITVTDPKTKKSVSTTVVGARDEVLEKIEDAFDPSKQPQPAAST